MGNIVLAGWREALCSVVIHWVELSDAARQMLLFCVWHWLLCILLILHHVELGLCPVFCGSCHLGGCGVEGTLTPRGQRGVVEQARSCPYWAAGSLCALGKILPLSELLFPHSVKWCARLGVPKGPLPLNTKWLHGQVGLENTTFGQYRVRIHRLKQGSTA